MEVASKLNKFFDQWKLVGNRGKTYKIFTIKNFAFTPDIGELGLLNDNEIYLKAQGAVKEVCGIKHIIEIANLLESYSYGNKTYSQIKYDNFWRTLYQYESRLIYQVRGTALESSQAETIPCHQCGIVLPIELITVDHQKPQSGGEVEAIMKLLRNISYNLTQEGGTGAKGRALQKYIVKDKGALVPIPTKLGKVAHDGDKVTKNTLTDKGVMFISAICAAGAKDLLQSRAMNSFINLAPLCQACNSDKGNS